MQVLFDRCAGLDCHKKSVVACCSTPDELGKPHAEIAHFGTTTAELLHLNDWLVARGVTHVAMESTGVYWKPGSRSSTSWKGASPSGYSTPSTSRMCLVARPMSNVKDAQWLAELLRHGLVRPSFIPPQAQRDLRELTRERTNFVRQRATLVNRVQKVLEGANIKLGTVATNIMGVSGKAMLGAIAGGEDNAKTLAGLAQGRLRAKREELEQALYGRVREHHRFLLTELLCQIDSLDETIEHFDEQIRIGCEADEEVIELLDTIPGVGRGGAEMLVAEIGTDMSRFPSAGHLAAWAGLAPGNNESAGKRRSGKTRKGDPWLRTGLVQAARAASRSKHTYLGAQYRRLAARRGDKRALIAVAHSLLVIAYHVISRKEPYRELGGDYFDRRKPEAAAKQLVRRLEKLGYEVTMQLCSPCL